MPAILAASQLWMDEWQWSAKKLLHVHQIYFRKKFPFTKRTIESAADEAALNNDDDRAYLRHMVELKGLLSISASKPPFCDNLKQFNWC